MSNQNSNIIKRNDILTSKIVRKRDPYCFFPYCSMPSVHNCHIFGRRHMGTRFDPEAGAGGCAEHHLWIDTHPKQKKAMFIQKLGVVKYEQLEFVSNQNYNLMPDELRRINLSLKRELEEI